MDGDQYLIALSKDYRSSKNYECIYHLLNIGSVGIVTKHDLRLYVMMLDMTQRNINVLFNTIYKVEFNQELCLEIAKKLMPNVPQYLMKSYVTSLDNTGIFYINDVAFRDLVA